MSGNAYVDAWLAKGRSDLLNIDNNVAAAITPWDTVAFHAQQAAEKVLKAFLLHHDRPFPRTHDLSALLQLCSEVAPDLLSLAERCLRLSAYAVEHRYPGARGDDIGETEGLALRADAVAIWDAVVGRIDPERT